MMAYDKDKLFNQAISAIKENHLYFIEDVVAFLPCVKQTFYDLFKVDSDEMDAIKAELENNRITTKVKLRKKFFDGERSAELISLYKLIATDEERKALSMQSVDHTSGGEKIKINIIESA